MANPTSFDLNQAIREWREDLNTSPAFRAGDLDELESHLRDSVGALQNQPLSPHEAFWVARGRLGTGEALQSEFGKVNAEQLWLNRALWMVIGWLAVGAVSTWASALTNLGSLGIYALTPQAGFLAPLGAGLNLVVFIGLLALAWRVFGPAKGRVRQAGAWLKAHPKAAAFILFLLLAINGLAPLGSSLLMLKFMPMPAYAELMQWRWPIMVLPFFVWPPVLAWLLVRTQRKPAAQ